MNQDNVIQKILRYLRTYPDLINPSGQYQHKLNMEKEFHEIVLSLSKMGFDDFLEQISDEQKLTLLKSNYGTENGKDLVASLLLGKNVPSFNLESQVHSLVRFHLGYLDPKGVELVIQLCKDKNLLDLQKRFDKWLNMSVEDCTHMLGHLRFYGSDGDAIPFYNVLLWKNFYLNQEINYLNLYEFEELSNTYDIYRFLMRIGFDDVFFRTHGDFINEEIDDNEGQLIFSHFNQVESCMGKIRGNEQTEDDFYFCMKSMNILGPKMLDTEQGGEFVRYFDKSLKSGVLLLDRFPLKELVQFSFYIGRENSWPIFEDSMKNEKCDWVDFITFPFAFKIYGNRVESVLDQTKYREYISFFKDLSLCIVG